MDFFSLDTDVFVLCLRGYPEFLRKTIFVIGTGNRMGKFQFRHILLPLWDLNTLSLPDLHSFSGADIIGAQHEKEIGLFGKAFKDCDMEIKQAFAGLGKQAVLEHNIVRQLKHYVCLLYQPDTT